MRRNHLIIISVALAIVLFYQFTAVLGQNQPRSMAKGNDVPSMNIYDLGTLGGDSSQASAINAAGIVVGNSTISPTSPSYAFWWRSPPMEPLSAPEALTSRAYAVNAAGIVAGAVISDSNGLQQMRPALWIDKKYTALQTIGEEQGVATAINDANMAVGQTIGTTGNQILIWEDGLLTSTISIPDGVATVNAINNSRQIVGLIHDGAGNNAFLWEGGSFAHLGTLGGQSSIAYDVNDVGQIVGAAEIEQNLATHAFLWQNGQMVDLGTPSDVETATSVALGINDQGVIVGEAQFGNEMRAVMWKDGVILDLNTFLPPDSAWTLLRTAVSINDQGWIAGTGRIDGNEHAFLLKLAGLDYDAYLPIIASKELEPTPTATPSPTATATPQPTATPSPTPSTTGYDMTRYMIGDGRLYEVRFSDGSQARHQTQTENIRFWHTKGSEILAEWEELWFDRYYIYRGTDTSPGGGRYYTLYENNAKGSKWSPRYWRVGDLFERNPYVIFYTKSNCGIINSGAVRSWLLFEAYYPSFTFQTGITLKEVVQLAWLLSPNGQPEERYYYAKDYGLVGWSSRASGFSQISEVFGPGQRPDNKREIIPCLDDSLRQSLLYSPELNFGPLPEELARLVK